MIRINGIEITNSNVIETETIDTVKVQCLARYINEMVNKKTYPEKADYTRLFQEDIIKNYSKIMNLQWYNFNDLNSVKKIIGKSSFIIGLNLKLDEDSITRPDTFSPYIVYGTPEFIMKEYKKIMQQVYTLHQTNAFQNNLFDVVTVTEKKQAYRRYIRENGIEGIDIFIPQVKIDHNKIEMIADAIMKQYGKEYKDKETMRRRILEKLEDKWSEIVTEAQVMDVNKLFGEELKEMGHNLPDEYLFVKNDFVYLGDCSNSTTNVIYATQEALADNLAAIDRNLASREFYPEEQKLRNSLVIYANEHGFNINIPSLEKLASRKKSKRKAKLQQYGDGLRKCIHELDDELTELQAEEQQVKKLYSQCEEELSGKSH